MDTGSSHWWARRRGPTLTNRDRAAAGHKVATALLLEHASVAELQATVVELEQKLEAALVALEAKQGPAAAELRQAAGIVPCLGFVGYLPPLPPLPPLRDLMQSSWL